MFSNRTTTNCLLGLTLGGAVGVVAFHLSVISAPAPGGEVQAQTQTPGAAPAAPDLQKQVDDALKELDKLEKINPDQPEQMKQQFNGVRQRLIQINGNGIFIAPGFNGNIVGNRLAGQGRLGVTLQRPASVLVDQLRLPAGQGLVIGNVVPESAAAKAGILPNDILLELDGRPVPSDVAMFQKDVREIKAGTELTAGVLRRGQKETIKGLKLPDAKGEAFGLPAPQPFPIQPNIQPGLIPKIQIFPPAGGPGGGVIQFQAFANGSETMKVEVVNDKFKVEYSSGEMTAVVAGSRENGQSTPSEINIVDGETKIDARSMDQVPERYRATIRRMIESVK